MEKISEKEREEHRYLIEVLDKIDALALSVYSLRRVIVSKDNRDGFFLILSDNLKRLGNQTELALSEIKYVSLQNGKDEQKCPNCGKIDHEDGGCNIPEP